MSRCEEKARTVSSGRKEEIYNEKHYCLFEYYYNLRV